MKKIPLNLKLFVLILCGVVLSFPLQIMSLYGYSPDQLSAIFSKISLLNMIVMFLCAVNIPLLLRASRKTLITLPLLFLAVIWNNLVVGYFGEDFSLLSTSLATLGFFSLNGLMLHKDVRYLLKNQNQRWWLQAERKQIRLPMHVDFLRTEGQVLEAFDMSETGAFLSVENDSQLDFVDPPKPGDVFDLKFKLGSLHHLKCQARVVRRTDDATGRYPRGLGVQFVDMENEDRRFLKRYLGRLPSPVRGHNTDFDVPAPM